VNRRSFLKVSAGSVGSLLLPIDFSGATPRSADPHFFLQVYIYGGIDSLFMFDGRPKEMTAAGLAHAYLAEDATPWRGDNGAVCLAGPATKALVPHRKNFTVINGVHMTTAFDGHLQNINFLFTGNAFGGECFVPHLNVTGMPLDAIQISGFAMDQNNGGKSIPLTPGSAFNLVKAIREARKMDPSQSVMAYMDSRFQSLGQGEGLLSSASRRMRQAYADAPAWRKNYRVWMSPADTEDAEKSFIGMMAGFFKEGICRSAVFEINPPETSLDVHAASSAKKQPQMYQTVAGRVAKIFDLLKTTPFDANSSLLDVTTVLFSSEFGRTLRQPGLPLNETGTDHNALSNSLLIGGKGIAGGRVIGESDWRTPQEKLSAAHNGIDSAGIKTMGKPFDFENQRPRQDLPLVFDADNYLNIGSVINTVYSLFDVPKEKWRTVKRDGPNAPLLTSIVK
jgi:hypothetical protein